MANHDNKPTGQNSLSPNSPLSTEFDGAVGSSEHQERSIMDLFASWLHNGESLIESSTIAWYHTKRFAYILAAATSVVAVVLAISLTATVTNYNSQLAKAKHEIDSLASRLSEKASSSSDDTSSNSNADSSSGVDSSSSGSSDTDAKKGDTLTKLMAKAGYDIKAIQSVDDANNAYAFELGLYDYVKTLGYGVSYAGSSSREISSYIDGLHLECNANNPNIDVRYVTVLPDYESGKFVMSYREYAGASESDVWSASVIPKCGTGATVDIPSDAATTPSEGVYYKELQKATYDTKKLTIGNMRRTAVGYGLPGEPPKYSDVFEAWASYHGYDSYSYTSSYMTCGDDLLELDINKTPSGADYPIVGYYSNDATSRQLLKTIDVQSVEPCMAN